MRDDMREAIGETVQGLVNLGLPITFTTEQLAELKVIVPEDMLRGQQVQPRGCKAKDFDKLTTSG